MSTKSVTVEGSSILTTALEQHNADIAKANVAKVRGEMSIISDYKAQIKSIEKKIAEAQKRIIDLDATPALVAKDVVA